MGVVIMTVGLFCFLANVHCFIVKLVHVVQERKIVICVRMLRVLSDAIFKIFSRPRVLMQLEVCQSQVVIKLWVDLLMYLAQLEWISLFFEHDVEGRCEVISRILVLHKLIVRHSAVKECEIMDGVRLLEVSIC